MLAREERQSETAFEAAYKAAGGQPAWDTLLSMISAAKAKDTPQKAATALWRALLDYKPGAMELMLWVLRNSELLGSGQSSVDAHGIPGSNANPEQTNPSREGRPQTAADGQWPNALRDGTNLIHVDDYLRRPPGRSKRGAEAIASIQNTLRRGALWKHKTADGIFWAEVSHHELKKRSRDGGIAKEFLEYVPTASDPFAKLIDIIPNDIAKKILEAAHAS